MLKTHSAVGHVNIKIGTLASNWHTVCCVKPKNVLNYQKSEITRPKLVFDEFLMIINHRCTVNEDDRERDHDDGQKKTKPQNGFPRITPWSILIFSVRFDFEFDYIFRQLKVVKSRADRIKKVQ